MPTSIGRGAATITPRQLELLQFLARSHQMTVGDVAQALQISAAAATKAITRLERKGLVTRTVDIMDRRCIHVRLTRFGTETALRAGSST